MRGWETGFLSLGTAPHLGQRDSRALPCSSASAVSQEWGYWWLPCSVSSYVLLLSLAPLLGRGQRGSHFSEVTGTLCNWTRSTAQPSPTTEDLPGEVTRHQLTGLSVVECISLPFRPLSRHFKPHLSTERDLGGWHQDQTSLHTWKVLQGWKKLLSDIVYLCQPGSAGLLVPASHLPTQGTGLAKSILGSCQV